MIAAAVLAPVARVPAMPLLSRLVAAAAATLLVNGFNFALGLLLVRSLTPRAFGAWAMVTTLQAIASVFLTALVAQQMAYALPRLRHPARLRAQASAFTSVAAWCVMGFMPVTIVTLYALDLPLGVAVAGSAFVAATGLRNHARFHLYALRRPRAVLAQDATFVTLATISVALIAASGWWRSLGALLAALTFANVAVLAWSRSLPAPALTHARLRRHLVASRRHAARGWWSLVTTALSTLSVLAPNLALASTGSLAALAMVAAPAALLAPVRLVALTFQASLRAEFSALVHADRRRAALLLYTAATLLALSACLLLGGALWATWDWLGPRVFAHGYDPALLRRATMLVFATAAVNVVRLPGAVLLNALGVFRLSALTWGIVAPVVLVLAVWSAHAGAIVAVLYPALAGEAVLFGVELIVLRRRMR